MFSETIELRGHIIDSLILPKVLDEILRAGGNFKIREIKIGERRADQSYARIEVSGPTHETLDELVLRLRQHGAEIEVQPAIMDSGIAVDREAGRATAVKFYEVRKGMKIVAGHQGIRVAPIQRSTARTDVFEFMSNVSVEQPKSAIIREMAREFKRTRDGQGRILVVAGPAVVHTGAAEHLARIIQWGYGDLLFAGNALAVHDIENALFGTSLGVNLGRADLADQGHENH